VTYTLAPFINRDISNTITWIKIGDKFTITKTGICL
jgi:hypothetical protein